MTARSGRVLVVGSANVDVVLQVPRNPVVGESLLVDGQAIGLGGKGMNRAVALSRLGADLAFYAKIAKDANGQLIEEAYEREGFSDEFLLRDEHAATGTGTAYVLVDGNGHNTILSYMGTNNAFTADEIGRIVDKLSGFGYLSIELECSLELVEALLHRAAQIGVSAIVDAGPAREVPLSWFSGTYLLSPNETEAAYFTGMDTTSEKQAREACRKLYESGCRYVLLKRGERGALLYDGTTWTSFPAYRGAGDAVDTTAAGDCFMAALTHALSAGSDLHTSIRYANVVAAISVTRHGALASLPTGDEASAMCAKAKQEGYLLS